MSVQPDVKLMCLNNRQDVQESGGRAPQIPNIGNKRGKYQLHVLITLHPGENPQYPVDNRACPTVMERGKMSASD